MRILDCHILRSKFWYEVVENRKKITGIMVSMDFYVPLCLELIGKTRSPAVVIYQMYERNGITLLPSYGNSPLDATQAIELIRAKRVPVEPLITHRLSLAETGLGFRLVAEAGESIKVFDPFRVVRPAVRRSEHALAADERRVKINGN